VNLKIVVLALAVMLMANSAKAQKLGSQGVLGVYLVYENGSPTGLIYVDPFGHVTGTLNGEAITGVYVNTQIRFSQSIVFQPTKHYTGFPLVPRWDLLIGTYAYENLGFPQNVWPPGTWAARRLF
jgi:hypothetical protein